MTNEEAIDVLMYLWRHEISERNTEGEIRRALNMGMAAIKREQRWIPVTERLPDKGYKVLVTSLGYIMTAKKFNENEWYLNDVNKFVHTADIEAWMPLPKPYKAESEDKA